MCYFILYLWHNVICVCVCVCVPFHQVQPQLSTVRKRHQLQTRRHAHLTFNLWSHSDYPPNLEEENKGLKEAINSMELFYFPLLFILCVVCVDKVYVCDIALHVIVCALDEHYILQLEKVLTVKKKKIKWSSNMFTDLETVSQEMFSGHVDFKVSFNSWID